MRGFAKRHTVDAALAWLDAQLQPLAAEHIPLHGAAGRVLAECVASAVDVPGFDRATMDGYAVVADSTEGATSYNRLTLTVIGDSVPGNPFNGVLSPGQAVRIMTGAPMPRGSDAVLPAEWVEMDAEEPGAHASACSPAFPPERIWAGAERTSSVALSCSSQDACCVLRISVSSAPSATRQWPSAANRGCD